MISAVITRAIRLRSLFTAATVDAESVSVHVGLTCRERRQQRYNKERPETACKALLKVVNESAPVTFPKLMEVVKQKQQENPHSPLCSVTSGQKLKKILTALKRTNRVFALNPGKQASSSHFVYHTGKGLRPNLPKTSAN